MITMPIATSANVAPALLDLFVLLLAAKIGDEIFKRMGWPSLIGEILAGIVVGPSLFGIVSMTETVQVFSELGVIFLLFWVGIETRLSDIKAVGSTATKVAVLGMALPVGAGFGAAIAFNADTPTALFVGAALAATSVGITSAILSANDATATPAGRTILGAAVIDDVLALVLLAVAAGLAESGGIDAAEVVLALTVAVGFVAFVAVAGTRVTRNRPELLDAPRFAESPLLPAVVLCLGLAVLSAEVGLAAVIGAFLAGMIVAETKHQNAIELEIAPLYAFFPPFFFAAIGLQVDLNALANTDTLLLLAGVTTLAVITKFAGAWLGARSLGSTGAKFVGLAMIPRGEVGIIVAGIGRASGVIDSELFTVIVGMSVLTTLAVPPLLARMAPELARSQSETTG